MLIDLHAHTITAGMMEQDPKWGPFYDVDERGQARLRIGDWRLGLTTKERKQALTQGVKEVSGKVTEQRFGSAKRIDEMDAAGVDKLVVSPPAHCFMYHTDPEFNIRYATVANEELAAYCGDHPDRLYFWAHLPMQAPEAAAKELDRAVTHLGAKGAALGGANFGGYEFDSRELYPVWDKVCELEVPVFVHGYNQSVTWGAAASTERYDITSVVGMCHDESSCFWNLVCGGVLDDFPGMKVYITHGGGYVPYQLGRFAGCNDVLDDAKNKKPLREYLPNFYFDPYVHHPSMRQAIVDVIGADQLVYGDNFQGSDGLREQLTDGLDLTDADRDKIRYKNAAALLKLNV